MLNSDVQYYIFTYPTLTVIIYTIKQLIYLFIFQIAQIVLLDTHLSELLISSFKISPQIAYGMQRCVCS